MDTFFSEYRIIDDDLCNVLCDQIMAAMRDNFKDKDLDSFVLSGRLASNLQTGEEIAIRNVVFVTDKRNVFDYHQQNAKEISATNTGIIQFKNCTLVNFQNLFIEVWFINEALQLGKYQDLPVQLISQIPIETL